MVGRQGSEEAPEQTVKSNFKEREAKQRHLRYSQEHATRILNKHQITKAKQTDAHHSCNVGGYKSNLCGRLHGRAYLAADEYLSLMGTSHSYLGVAGHVFWHVYVIYTPGTANTDIQSSPISVLIWLDSLQVCNRCDDAWRLEKRDLLNSPYFLDEKKGKWG